MDTISTPADAAMQAFSMAPFPSLALIALLGIAAWQGARLAAAATEAIAKKGQALVANRTIQVLSGGPEGFDAPEAAPVEEDLSSGDAHRVYDWSKDAGSGLVAAR